MCLPLRFWNCLKDMLNRNYMYMRLSAEVFPRGITKPTMQKTSDVSKIVMLKARQERNLCLQDSILAPYVNPPS